MFRHFVVLLPFAIMLELGMLLYGGYLIFRDPGWASPKGLMFVLVWIGANLVLLDLISKLWRTRSTFTVSSSHLVVADPIRRTRSEVPWATILLVERIPQYWWNRGGGIRLNEIVLEGEQRILFGTHLSGYSRFVAALARNAVNSKRVDPYPVGIGERVQ